MQNLPHWVSAKFAISRSGDFCIQAGRQILPSGFLRAGFALLKDAEYARVKSAEVARDSNHY
jgi:hypothetical protein